MKLIYNAVRFLPAWRKVLSLVLACMALLASTAGGAWADPPSRAGRIADVTGTAWLFDPETKVWVRVLRNQTLGQGDQLRTDIRSRVTVRIGSSTVWLDEQSDVEVLQMDDAATVLRLATGDVAVRLRSAQAAQETRIQTREGVVSPEIDGLFRIDQLDRGTRLAVLQGRAQFDSDPGAPAQRAWLREGEQAEFWWAESPRLERQPMVRDKFRTWFLAQDQAEGALPWGDESYVSPEMTGAEDLLQNGTWEVATEYGNVWIPTRVATDWEPYRDGNWVWTRQWGWSWADNAPWGFAPFHYGRWVQHRGRWAWAPGRFEARPAYAPALVAWVGGPQVSVGITIGTPRRPPQAGWVVLAPRQSYVPAYPHSPQYSERFRWDKAANNATRNDGNGRTRFESQRSDPGPQSSRPWPISGTGANPNNAPISSNGVWPRPWNRNDGSSGPREDGRREGLRNPQQAVPNPANVAIPAQPTVIVQPQQPPGPTQPERQWGRDRTLQPPNNSGDNRENRESTREQRNRESGPPAPRQPSVTPQGPAFVPPPVPPQIQQPQRQGQQQAKPSDDERPSGMRNKREIQDRDLR